MTRSFAARNAQLILSLALLLVLIVFAALFSGQKPPRPYDLDAAGTGGLRALRLWLEKLGYSVEHTGNQMFTLPDDVALLFVYPNVEPFTPQEATALHDWVAGGRTLVLLGPTTREVALIDTFGVDTTFADGLLEEVTQQQPLLPASDVTWPQFGGLSVLQLTKAPSVVPFMTTRSKTPVIALQHVGRGVVWHLSQDFALTNAQLHDANLAALVIALLRNVPAHGKLLFDTYHLYGPELSSAQAQQIGTLQEWLYRTPFGWATLFALGAVLFYLSLQGRRLGPALPVLTEKRRREAAEYVEAMAALYRRAQQREAVAQHHKRRLKLALGRSVRISPALPDGEFVQRLQAVDQHLSEADLQSIQQLLHNLDNQTNEGALVRMAAQIDEILATRK